VLATIVVLVLATACQVDLRVDVEMEADGSGVVTVGVGFDDEALARVPDLESQLRTDDLVEAGWTVSALEQGGDGVSWLRASKPFSDADQAADILDGLAGPDGPFRDFSASRDRAFGRTTYTVEGVADFSDGFAAFADDQLVELVGDGLGGNLEQIESDTGEAPAEQVSVTVAVSLPGAGTQVFELDPTSTEPQPIDASTTATRWAAAAWAVLAAVALVLLVVVVAVRLVRDQRERSTVPAEGAGPPDDVDDVDPPVDPTDAAEVESAVAPGTPMAPRRLGVVVLDAMGVVFDTGADVTSLLADFLRDQGINLAHDQVGASLAEASLGQITPAEMWRSFGVEANQAELTDQFLALHRPSPGLRSFLERMRERDLAVVGVSNDIAEWSHRLRDTHKLADLTAGWLVSSEVGRRLPDPAVYEAVTRASGEDPRNTFFIDHELRFLAAARSAGFAVAWFNPDPEPGDENAGYSMIRSFREFGGEG
jgi:HAD superfamily hydrolase (TIGR01509 family)